MKKTAAELLEAYGLANDLTLDAGGWAFIPYGDSRHSGMDARQDVADANKKKGKAEKPVIQRFDRASAEALVNDFRSGLGVIKRAIVGLPIFKGHPDSTRFAKLFPDKTPRGTIADMEATDTGLRFRPVLTEEGAALVNSGWSDFSPYWLLHKISEEGGMPVVSPFQLLSVGLVPKGNIAGLSFINAALSENPMKELLLKLLAALGKPVAAAADDAALANAVDTALPTIAAANAAVTQLATVQTENSTLKTQVAEATTARQTAETALANVKIKVDGKEVALANVDAEILALANARNAERQARATLLANAAVTEGRLPANERDATVTALCNAADFAVEAAKLAARTKTLPVDSKAKGLGSEGRGATKSRGDQILALVNARMESAKEDYEVAYTNVQRDPAHSSLFTPITAAK